MNKIAIVEDRLKNAVLIARQLQDWLIRENLDNVIELKKVLLFSVSEEAFRTELEKFMTEVEELDLDVERTHLWDFDDKLDEFMDDVEKKNFLLIDFLLSEDGSEGVPQYRVNIRYARRQNGERKKRLFFYTLSGLENFNLLCQLVGEEQVLPSKYENGEPPCLDLQNIDNFRDAIQEIINNE